MKQIQEGVTFGLTKLWSMNKVAGAMGLSYMGLRFYNMWSFAHKTAEEFEAEFEANGPYI